MHARRSRVLPTGQPLADSLPPSSHQPGQWRQQQLPVHLELDELPKATAVVIPQRARIPYRSHLCLYRSPMFTESSWANVAADLLGPCLYQVI